MRLADQHFHGIGLDNNLSWNCGAEEPSKDAAIERLRGRQVKNFMVTLLLSLGTPMLLMVDEMRRSQRGNNNAYCHDNEVSWLDWSLVEPKSRRRWIRIRQSLDALVAKKY